MQIIFIHYQKDHKIMKITAKEGKVFKRIIDGIIFGNEIYLGVDYSTGVARPDKVEYYIEVDEPIIEGILEGTDLSEVE